LGAQELGVTAPQALGWMLFWGAVAAVLNIAFGMLQLWGAPRKPPKRPTELSLWMPWLYFWLYFWLLATMLVGWRYLIQ